MVLFWFRRDLRLADNHGLYEALSKGQVLPLFIFDTKILNQFKDPQEARVSFIFEQVSNLKKELQNLGSDLRVYVGEPEEIFKKIFQSRSASDSRSQIQFLFANEDYEPHARERDELIKKLSSEFNIRFKLFKDQVIFAPQEVQKESGGFYTVYTPYKKRWLFQFSEKDSQEFSSQKKTQWIAVSHQPSSDDSNSRNRI